MAASAATAARAPVVVAVASAVTAGHGLAALVVGTEARAPATVGRGRVVVAAASAATAAHAPVALAAMAPAAGAAVTGARVAPATADRADPGGTSPHDALSTDRQGGGRTPVRPPPPLHLRRHTASSQRRGVATTVAKVLTLDSPLKAPIGASTNARPKSRNQGERHNGISLPQGMAVTTAAAWRRRWRPQ